MGSATSKVWGAASSCGGAIIDGCKMVSDLIIQVGNGVYRVVTNPVNTVISTAVAYGKIQSTMVSGAAGILCKTVGKVSNLVKENRYSQWLEDAGDVLNDFAIEEAKDAYNAIESTGAVEAISGALLIPSAVVGGAACLAVTPIVATVEGIVMAGQAIGAVANVVGVATYDLLTSFREKTKELDVPFCEKPDIILPQAINDEVKSNRRYATESERLLEQKEAQISQLMLLVTQLQAKVEELEAKSPEKQKTPANRDEAVVCNESEEDELF
jgi:molybdopterin converting factor small subunit